MNNSFTTSNRNKKYTKQKLIPTNVTIEDNDKNLYMKIMQKIRRVTFIVILHRYVQP